MKISIKKREGVLKMNTNQQVTGNTAFNGQTSIQPKKSDGWKWRIGGWVAGAGFAILGAVLGTMLLPGGGTAAGAGLGAALGAKVGTLIGLGVGSTLGYGVNMVMQNKANQDDALYLREQMMPQLTQQQSLPYSQAQGNLQQMQQFQNTGQNVANYPQGQNIQVQPGNQGQVPYQSSTPQTPQAQMAQVLQQQANQDATKSPMMQVGGPMGTDKSSMMFWLMQQAQAQNAMMALGMANNIMSSIMGSSMMEMGSLWGGGFNRGGGGGYPSFFPGLPVPGMNR